MIEERMRTSRTAMNKQNWFALLVANFFKVYRVNVRDSQHPVIERFNFRKEITLIFMMVFRSHASR